MPFTVTKDGAELKVKQGTFPGGEVLLTTEQYNYRFWNAQKPIEIIARIQNSNDLFALALLKDAIDRNSKGLSGNLAVNLILPYVPYARQDRACVQGEPNSVKVLGNYINSLGFNTVTIIDPHSDVTGAVINNANIISQAQVISKFEALNIRVLQGNISFISPDAGANKKTSELAKYFGHNSFIRADKLRNLATGEIIETRIYADDLQGQDIIIADDICDGGRTFTELAKALKAKNAGRIILYISHAIFSKGEEALFDNGIDEIYTTDSYKEKSTFSNKVNVFEIKNLR